MICFGTDQLDLLSWNFFACLEVNQVAIRLATGSALEPAVDDSPCAVLLGCRAGPLPLGAWIGGDDAMHRVANSWYINID